MGDCMPGRLRMMIMMVLETSVMTARMGMMTPSRGKTNSIGPREVVVSMVLQVPSLIHLKWLLVGGGQKEEEEVDSGCHLSISVKFKSVKLPVARSSV